MKDLSDSPMTIPKDITGKSPSEDASNENRGLLSLPYELWGEVLSNLKGIDNFTEAPRHGSYLDYPVLPAAYLEKTDVLRCLSQVCVAYRRNFLPFLWQALSVCFEARPGPDVKPMMFFRHVAETLVSKCEGLTRNPELAVLVRCVQVAVTRYQSASVIPTFASTLARLSNVHTLHILHAHTQITTALKEGFEGITLPQIRTLIVPGYCHEILKRCPNAKTVWCTETDGSKLITVIGTHCKEVTEIRGFDLDENRMKRVVKAVPNLQVIEIMPYEVEVFLEKITSFKDFKILIIKHPKNLDKLDQNDESTKEHQRHWDNLKKHCAMALRQLPPCEGTERRSLLIAHMESVAGKGGPRPVHYTKLEI